MEIGTNVFFQINLEENYSKSKNKIYIKFKEFPYSRNWTTIFGLQKWKFEKKKKKNAKVTEVILLLWTDNLTLWPACTQKKKKKKNLSHDPFTIAPYE